MAARCSRDMVVSFDADQARNCGGVQQAADECNEPPLNQQ